jgi:aminoglycoside 3-N-acetyltransferase I
MKIRLLQAGQSAEFQALIQIFQQVFEVDGSIPPLSQLRGLLANPDFKVFVAEENGQICGGLTVYLLHSYYSPQAQAYIYDVGVAPAFQGKGIGSELIEAVCDFARQQDCSLAYVEAEKSDLDAIRFYRKTKPDEELEAMHFTYRFE